MIRDIARALLEFTALAAFGAAVLILAAAAAPLPV